MRYLSTIYISQLFYQIDILPFQVSAQRIILGDSIFGVFLKRKLFEGEIEVVGVEGALYENEGEL